MQIVRAPRADVAEVLDDTSCPCTRAVLASTYARLVEHRVRVRDLVVGALVALEEEHQGAAFRELVRSFPELLHVPDLAELASRCGVITTRALVLEPLVAPAAAMPTAHRR